MDSKSPRDGRAIDDVGFYHPVEADENQIHIKEEKIRHWIEQGAQPSDTVRKLLNKKDFYLQ